MQLVAALAAKGHSVTLVCGNLPEDTEPRNVEIVRLAKHSPTGMAGRLRGWLSFMTHAAVWLARLPAPATVIACSNPPLMPHVAVAIGRVRRFAVVARVLDVYPDIFAATALRNQNLLRSTFAALNRWAYARCVAVLTLGERMAATLSLYTTDKKPEVIPEWITLNTTPDDISQAASRQRLQLPINHLLVLFSGNVGITHDLTPIAKAARELSGEPIHFVLCTSNPEPLKPLFQNTVVTIMPRASDEDYSALLTAVDMGVISLRSGAEAACFPSRAMAYLGSGIPLLAITDQPGDLADLIKNGSCGSLVKPADPAALAAAIRSYALDREKLRQARHNAQAVAAGFSADRWLPIFVDRVESIATQHIGQSRSPWFNLSRSRLI